MLSSSNCLWIRNRRESKLQQWFLKYLPSISKCDSHIKCNILSPLFNSLKRFKAHFTWYTVTHCLVMPFFSNFKNICTKIILQCFFQTLWCLCIYLHRIKRSTKLTLMIWQCQSSYCYNMLKNCAFRWHSENLRCSILLQMR